MPTFRIISTIGPKSRTAAFVKLALELGQGRVRVNASHLGLSELEALLGFLAPTGAAITLDLQGRKKRIGELEAPLDLTVGASVELVPGDRGPRGSIPLPDTAMFASLSAGDVVALMDRQVELVVEAQATGSGSGSGAVRARVIKGQRLRSRAGIHVDRSSRRRTEADDASPVDAAQLELAARFRVDTLALSFTARGADLTALETACAQVGYAPRLVAKLETTEGLEALRDIASAADEVWLCRGDLGSLVPGRTLAALQRRVLSEARALGVPCVVAGQVFHHLTEHLEPTRSEVVHLFEILEAGAQGIVLSDETAIGVSPENALRSVVGLL